MVCERASTIAPVMRMCYAEAVFGGEGGCCGKVPDKASVIYLGEQCGGSRDLTVDWQDSIYNANILKQLFSGLPPCGENDAQTVYVKGIGTFVCSRGIDSALRGAARIFEATQTQKIAGAIDNDNKQETIVGGNKPGDSNNVHTARGGRLAKKIALITGGAQGFGRGIALELAAEGAYVAIADMNLGGARECAAEIENLYGMGHAIAIEANVTIEDSVAAMVRETVLSYGGLDLFISNAGILVAGSLPEMTKEAFERVTSVNYTGYFLGVKYASVPMKLQRSACASYTADIIEINSKSGLEGSNKNFAYAGSKFGGVGLTQSFALELIEHGIKVNAVCPGNFLDGPLWSDPVKGLFKQYLDAGKVPGAKNVGDVRRYYESRVPMKRGCTVSDVFRAVCYLVEQQYETGQALPVTGGQVMLN